MTADISWDQLQAGNNCKICLKTCCLLILSLFFRLLLNSVSFVFSPPYAVDDCAHGHWRAFCCFTFVFFPSLKNNRIPSWQNLSWYASQAHNLFSSQHIFSLQCSSHLRCVCTLCHPPVPPPPPAAEKRKQRHHHSCKNKKGTKKNQDILAINFSRLVEVISLDIFCMKYPKAKLLKIKSIVLRGRPRSRVSAERSAQLFGVC